MEQEWNTNQGQPAYMKTSTKAGAAVRASSIPSSSPALLPLGSTLFLQTSKVVLLQPSAQRKVVSVFHTQTLVEH